MAPHRAPAGDLPWGWWLTADASGFVDGDGRRWRSVRDAFWQGRLGFPDIHVAPEQHELLLRVLTSLDRRLVGVGEARIDLFTDMMFWRFYLCWLVSVGFTRVGEGPFGTAFEAGLTDEGRSVMLMLQATREPAWGDLPFPDIVEAVRTAGRGAASQARESELRAFEVQAAHLPWLFARERVARLFVVTLTGIAVESRMPTRRVVWSLSFEDEVVRDDFFGWLAERVERWEDWGSIAYRSGASELTGHLLALTMASGAVTT